jgi:rod shape-determining protein MreD
MLVDLAPPADTTLGVNAIVYVVIGFAAALFVDRRDRTVPLLIAIVAVSAAAATLGVAALDSLLGSARVQWDSMAVMVVTSAIYAVVMAPVVVLGIAWLVRRIAPEDAAIVTG